MARPFNQYSIIDVVAEWYSVNLKELQSPRRSRTVVLARHTAFYLIHDMTKLSFPEIGALFDRDHSTVIKALENINRRLSDVEYQSDIDELRTLITQRYND